MICKKIIKNILSELNHSDVKKNPVTEATGLVLTKGLGVNLLLATFETYIRIIYKSRDT